MDNHNARIFQFAQAEYVRAMAMEADNKMRVAKGEYPVYGEDDFNHVANNIENYAREMG